MEQQLFGAFFAIVIGVGACALYYFASNRLLDLALPFRARRPSAVRNQKLAVVDPAVALSSARRFSSSRHLPRLPGRSPRSGCPSSTAAGENFVGLQNYVWAVNDDEFRQSIFNNILWLLVVPALHASSASSSPSSPTASGGATSPRR